MGRRVHSALRAHVEKPYLADTPPTVRFSASYVLELNLQTQFNSLCVVPCRCSSVAEQRFRKPQVKGSNPLTGSTSLRRLSAGGVSAGGLPLRSFGILCSVTPRPSLLRYSRLAPRSPPTLSTRSMNFLPCQGIMHHGIMRRLIVERHSILSPPPCYNGGTMAGRRL